MIRAAIATLCLLGPLRAQDAPAFDPYPAHIAAAEGAMARGATAEVRRWLDAVPPPHRAFEWHLLDAEADQSDATHPAHADGVSALALAPDDALLATGGNDGSIVLWRTADMQPVRTIRAHRSTVLCVGFDARGDRLASASSDRTVRVWRVTDGAPLCAFEKHTYPVSTVRWAPDGERLCSTSYQRPKGGEVRIWNATDGAELAVLQSGYAPMTCAHWNADGTRIVAASWDQQLHVFDLATPDSPQIVRLAPGSEYAAAQASALSPDGGIVAVACKDNAVHLFAAWTAQRVRDLGGHRKVAEGVAFSADGATLATASADSSIRLWQVADGAPVARLLGHRGAVRALTFNADGSRLFSGGADGTLRTWIPARARFAERRIRFAETAYHVAESPDGTRLAVGFAEGSLRLYSTDDGRELASLPRQEDGWIASLQWSADGGELLAAGSHGAHLWRVADRTLVRAFPEGKRADAAARSHDGSLVAAVSRDNKVRLWDAATGTVRWTTDTADRTQVRLEFAPDGGVLAVVGQAGAALHDPRSGEVRVRLVAGHRGRVSAVGFVPPAGRVVTLGEDGALCLFDADGTLRTKVPQAHDAPGRALAVAPDGSRFATCGEDDRLVLWDATTLQPVWARDVADGYCMHWSRDGRRLWVLPLGKEVFCLDAVPLRAR